MYKLYILIYSVWYTVHIWRLRLLGRNTNLAWDREIKSAICKFKRTDRLVFPIQTSSNVSSVTVEDTKLVFFCLLLTAELWTVPASQPTTQEKKNIQHTMCARNVVYERSGPISLELVVTAPWCLFKLNLLPFHYITPSSPPPLRIASVLPAVFLVLLLLASKPNKNSETGTLSESFNARGTVQMVTSCSFLFSRFKHNSPLYKFFWPHTITHI